MLQALCLYTTFILSSNQVLEPHSKPQTYLVAILPASNQMHSVLLDYTGGDFQRFDPVHKWHHEPGTGSELDEEEDEGGFTSAHSSLQDVEEVHVQVHMQCMVYNTLIIYLYNIWTSSLVRYVVPWCGAKLGSYRHS